MNLTACYVYKYELNAGARDEEERSKWESSKTGTWRHEDCKLWSEIYHSNSETWSGQQKGASGVMKTGESWTWRCLDCSQQHLSQPSNSLYPSAFHHSLTLLSSYSLHSSTYVSLLFPFHFHFRALSSLGCSGCDCRKVQNPSRTLLSK